MSLLDEKLAGQERIVSYRLSPLVGVADNLSQARLRFSFCPQQPLPEQAASTRLTRRQLMDLFPISRLSSILDDGSPHLDTP